MAIPAEFDSESDAELLTASDEIAERFGVFYDRHFEAVFAFFVRRTDCSAVAADLTSETFATAYNKRKRFRPDRGNGQAWLFGIGRNLLRRYYRKNAVEARARERLGMSMLDYDEIATANIDLAADPARRKELREALDMLSPNVRDAVLLRVALDLPYEEIARRLRCSVGAARIRVLRGKSFLADRLRDL